VRYLYPNSFAWRSENRMENNPVIGSYILNRGRLKFRTARAVLAQEALQAKSASRDFTVRLASNNRAQSFERRADRERGACSMGNRDARLDRSVSI
jgi:hypothetical protein